MANVLVFGASIVQGFHDTRGGWVNRLKNDLLKYSRENNYKKDLKIYNLGISGDTSTDVLKRFDHEVKPRNWKSQKTIVIFAIGINDTILINGKLKTPEAKFRKNLETLSQKAGKFSEYTIFVGPSPVVESRVGPMPWSPTESYHNKNIRHYDKIIKNFCAKKGHVYIEVFSKFWERDYEKLLPDGVHPNPAGHKLMFKIIKESLMKNKLLQDF
ncbi:SGNH/GDSL hydrolase family protein [Patescibacteria group bacterium]